MSEQAFQRLIAPVMRRLRLMIGRAVVTLVNDSLKPASPHPALAREALAQATWPIYAYKYRLFHL